MSRINRSVLFTRLRRFLDAARQDVGQTTAEYALVLLGAAGIAVLLVGWATQSGAIGTLFDAVLDGIVGRVE